MKTQLSQLNKTNTSIYHYTTKQLLLTILLVIPAVLWAQKPIDSLSFATDGEVIAAEIYENYLYIGGHFSYVGEKTGSAAFFHNGSSEPDYTMPIFGKINTMSDEETHEVNAVVPDGKGGWYVGGAFEIVNNRKHLFLVHILPDKQVDERFVLPFNNNSSVGMVFTLKKEEDVLYVGGFFGFDEGGQRFNGVFRINLNTKKIDLSWNPHLQALDFVDQIELGKNKVFLSGNFRLKKTNHYFSILALDKSSAAPVFFPTTTTSKDNGHLEIHGPAIHLMGDTLFMGKLFSKVLTNGFGNLSGGISFFDTTGKLLSDSVMDGVLYEGVPDGKGGFYVAGQWGTQSGIFHIDSNRKPVEDFSQTKIHLFDILGANLTLGNNSLYVTSASYTHGVSLSVKGKTIKALFKLDAATGEIDTAFAPNPNGQVYVTLLKGDTLLVGGSFSEIGGVSRTGLAAVNANTGAVYDWDPSFKDTDGFYLGYGKHHVSDLTLVHDTLYVSGIFLTNSESKTENISSLVRYDLATGTLDTTFHVSRSQSSLTIPDFHSMAYDKGKLYATGHQLNLKDTRDSLLEHFAVVDVNTLKINSLNDFVFAAFKPLTFNLQGKLKVQIQNGILYLTNFLVVQTPSLQLSSYITAIDLSTQKYVLWSLSPSGAVYTFAMSGGNMLLSGSFDMVKWNGSELVGVDIRTNKFIDFPTVLDVQHSVCFAHNDKYLFIGSGFEEFGDSTVHGLVRLKRNGLIVTHFNHQINGDDNNNTFFVRRLALGKEGLYVTGFYNTLAVAFGNSSGAFASVAGKARQNICLLDPENATLKSWNPPPYNSESCSVFAYGDDIVMTGAFNLMPAWSRSRLAKINLTTGKLDDWNPSLGEHYAIVHAMLVSHDTVFIGGDEISKLNDKDVGNLLAIHANTGSLLEGFAPPDMDGGIYSLYKKGNQLYAGGNFKNIDAVSHNLVARFNSTNGSVDDWDPHLEGSWNLNVNDILVQDTLVYLAGGGLGIAGNTGNNIMMRVSAKTAALKKLYPGTNYAAIGSIAVNDRGDMVAGMSINVDEPEFYRLDKTNDTLVPVENVPQFASGISKIRSLGNYFLVSGNHIKEKGKTSKKPGLFVYDPVEDTVTASFSTPVIDGDISTIAANDQVLVFAGDFGGMNQDKHNADIAFMQTPDLQLQPGITSWSPKTANTFDPFAVAVYGSGFTQNAQVSLISENTTKQPDSLKITPRKITAYFSGKNFTVGKWDLKVDIGTENPVLYAEAIDIKKGKKPEVWIDWSSPDVVRVNKPANCYLSFGNRGNSAALGVFIYLGVGTNQVVELPKSITHLEIPFAVDWDTISSYVDVDYFLGEPFHGKVYTIFVPYLPAGYSLTYHLKITTTGTESSENEIKYAISKPLFNSMDELTIHNKSAQGKIYNFFRCAYDVVGIVADLTPGVGCVKSFFDNTVVVGVDKYMDNESVSGYDVVNSVGMIVLGCVPGGKEMGMAGKVSREMVEMGADASGAFSSCKKLVDSADRDSKNMKSRFSLDPNAKYGPSGKATSKFVRTGQPFQYMITYENDSVATAAAQRVIITDTLDKSVFDLTSFKSIGFGFGDTAYFYKATDGDTVDIDLRPDKDIIVRVFYNLSQADGILTWTFLTLDPNTYELTDDAYAGFLPPNKKAPEGEGNVLYSIAPLPGLTDGSVINNSAHIIFDWNEAIPTDQWHNVTDNTLPESTVNSLPALSLNKNFSVSWGGTDQSSGVYSYSVYVAENDSAYYLWLPDTKDTTAVFSGEAGVTYKFYSTATDSAGNRETAPASYDAITQVSGTGIDNFGESHRLELRVYPNPARGQTTIGYSLPESESLRIDLLNGCGHLVKTVYEGSSTRGKRSVKVDLSTLPAGFYFVRINTKQGVQTRKLIKK